MILDRWTRDNLEWADRVHDLWARLPEHRSRMVFWGRPAGEVMLRMRVPAEPPWPSHWPRGCTRPRSTAYEAASRIAEARALASYMMAEGRTIAIRDVDGYEGWYSVDRACDPPLSVRVLRQPDPVLWNDQWIVDSAWKIEPVADHPCIASPVEPGGRIRSMWTYGPSYGICHPTRDEAGPIRLDPPP